MFKYLFGPVPSRRLGMSLGVDLVPKKVCTLDCIYCEVGKTTKLTTRRMEYIPYKKITDEIDRYFISNPDPDYITFSGYGEPTLNSGLGKIMKYIKEKKTGIPLAVLTNGTLFDLPEVRKELLPADLVLPSLDAASQNVFNKINRPYPELNVNDHINCLIEFRKEFKGTIWLEIFILPGYNDPAEELDNLKEAVLKINPDKIQLNTLDRPGTVEGLSGASFDELQQIIDYWKFENIEIIAKAPSRKLQKSYRKDIEDAITGTIERRPCTADDLAQITGTHINEINKYLEILESEKKIEHKREKRGIFYYPVR
ncbi:MAG: radical SAM protein [Bacteroidales bacterium]|nr:radical SAM protein [Bacteroidales bacterium]